MYEMEGPRPASPRQVDQFPGFAGAARRPPVPDTRAREPVSRLLRRSRDYPGAVPVSNGESISTAFVSLRARPCDQ
jgi:hypothetical protein